MAKLLFVVVAIFLFCSHFIGYSLVCQKVRHSTGHAEEAISREVEGCLIFRHICQLHLLQLRSVLYDKSSVADGLTRDEAQVVFAMNGLTTRGLDALQAPVGQARPGTLVF